MLTLPQAIYSFSQLAGTRSLFKVLTSNLSDGSYGLFYEINFEPTLQKKLPTLNDYKKEADFWLTEKELWKIIYLLTSEPNEKEYIISEHNGKALVKIYFNSLIKGSFFLMFFQERKKELVKDDLPYTVQVSAEKKEDFINLLKHQYFTINHIKAEFDLDKNYLHFKDKTLKIDLKEDDKKNKLFFSYDVLLHLLLVLESGDVYSHSKNLLFKEVSANKNAYLSFLEDKLIFYCQKEEAITFFKEVLNGFTRVYSNHNYFQLLEEF